MSISTKRGDQGETDLMFGRRVSKADPRVGVYGAVDELNAALGLCRVHARRSRSQRELPAIQQDLVVLMGELATLPDDLSRYLEKGKEIVSETMVNRLTELGKALEEEDGIHFSDWAMPGEAGSVAGASLDMARTLTRRSERGVVALWENGEIRNEEIVRYLNRLSDVLWLLARLEEKGEDE